MNRGSSAGEPCSPAMVMYLQGQNKMVGRVRSDICREESVEKAPHGGGSDIIDIIGCHFSGLCLK